MLRRCSGYRRALTLGALAVETQRRGFAWNPFAKAAAAAEAGAVPPPFPMDEVAKKNAKSYSRIVARAHRDATIHSERLLEASLRLLSYCSRSTAVTSSSSSSSLSSEPVTGGPRPPSFPASMAPNRSPGLDAQATGGPEASAVLAIAAVVDTTMRRAGSASLAAQFDVVYAALCEPVVAGHRQLQRDLLVVLEAVLPAALMRVFEAVDLTVVVAAGPADGAALRKRSVVRRFVHGLLGEVHAPAGVADEEAMAVYVDDLKLTFPAVAACPAFAELEEQVPDLALQAQLLTRLQQLCRAFDPENTGKVRLADIEATARRVLGPSRAAQLLAGADPDETDGTVRYQQFAALLTRPPPRPPGD